MITVSTVDAGSVQDKIKGNHQWTLEEGCEEYIKREMGE